MNSTNRGHTFELEKSYIKFVGRKNINLKLTNIYVPSITPRKKAFKILNIYPNKSRRTKRIHTANKQ